MIKIHSYIIWQRPKNFRFILTKGTEFIIGHLKAWTLVTFLIYKFSASAGLAAVTAGGDLGGLGDYPSTSVLAGRKPAKITNIYMFTLLASLITVDSLY